MDHNDSLIVLNEGAARPRPCPVFFHLREVLGVRFWGPAHHPGVPETFRTGIFSREGGLYELDDGGNFFLARL